MKRFLAAHAVVAAAGLFVAAPAFAEGSAKSKKAEPGKTSGDVARGKYLVTIGGCHDCHTPLKMGPNGPVPDMDRALSGHPEYLKMSEKPDLSGGNWGVVVAPTLTAWSGPWGTSFTANLTPDKETGLGEWTEQNFMETIRSGKHLGRGRAILPPMPWFNYAEMTDHDLKSVYAYLRTIPAVKNRVPTPLPPPQAKTAQK